MSFNDALENAANKLSAAADKLADRGDGRNALGQFVGQGGGGSAGPPMSGLASSRAYFASSGGMEAMTGAMGPAAGALGLVNAGARMLTPAANAYAMTGSSQAFASGITDSLLGAAESTGIGGFLLGAFGVTGARRTNQAAGDATADLTSSLAAIGVQITDDDRQRLFDINQAIQGRVTDERRKVEEIAKSAKELGDAGASESIVKALRSIEQIVLSIDAWLRSWKP